MPAIKYLCPACGLSFDRILSVKVEVVPCKRCGKEAAGVRTAAKAAFAHVPEGPVPQNTGVSSVDHDVDLVVARSSQQNLREMAARQDYKKRLMHQRNATGGHLARVPTGEVDGRGRDIDDYWVMSNAEKRLTEQVRPLAHQAARQIHQEALRRHPAAVPGTIDLGTEQR